MDERSFVSIPQGGPIYAPELISPLTSVLSFQQSLMQGLQALRDVIHLDPSQTLEEDFSVDDLAVFSDEELVNKALEEAFKESAEEEEYVQKVEELAKVKGRQDEDKASARLHSFNGSLKSRKKQSSEKAEQRRVLDSKGKVRSGVPPTAGVVDGEVVVRVEIHRTNRKKMTIRTQELLMLGGQLLTDLKDSISCVMDEIMKRREDNPPPSGYFFIEDTFFNDMRGGGAVDMSRPVLDWLEEKKEEAAEKWQAIVSGPLHDKCRGMFSGAALHAPSLRSARMEVTRLCDVRFRVGAAYLYCHHGDCKHMVVVRDMRLLHSEDPRASVSLYPIIIYQQRVRIHKCSVCGIYRATKMTVDDKWAPQNPSYFCHNCYFLLHYAQDGSLLYHDFSVYDYVYE